MPNIHPIEFLLLWSRVWVETKPTSVAERKPDTWNYLIQNPELGRSSLSQESFAFLRQLLVPPQLDAKGLRSQSCQFGAASLP